ncbi:Sporulation protein YunB [Caprobacter fermentans]|uniref:Sporulation protein YunB n=1 Tax=Caproicibacter fermentans TaxID=2576756 RepID=A0A6N8I5F5_9FIRM|nr:sporulation protein YunB [Caproicibacter fermentans]MVB12997.1 Sporulation protein YunB [Caproicibacter fermentans]OCN02469.1 sporulation protein YunB [Clostridium sp. W14A]QNK41265.1 sporulation protein YunB [Caproicibacter fermentans]
MRRRRRSPMPARGRLILFLFVFFAFILIFNSQIRPVIESITANEAKIKSVNTINNAVMEELNRDNISYDDLITVQRGSDGQVLAITTNMMKMNELKAKIIENIQDKLNNDTYSTVWVPLGTLIGGDFFHGKGPKIALKASLSGNVTAEFNSELTSAGINQTKHQIYLDINTSIYSFLPGFDATTDVKTNILVAETVVVGSVPQVVANWD